MPLYEYACEKCGDHFEVIQKFSDEPVRTHEKCGGPVHRLISAPALQFKGSGWYVTDYAKGSNTSAPASDNGSAPKSDSSSESKPAAKSDSPASSSGSSEKKSTPSGTGSSDSK